MTTSQFRGQIAWEATVELAGGGEGLDPSIVNDVALNNAAHLVDEQCQQDVAWISPSSSQFETWTAPTASASAPSPVAAYDLLIHPRPNGKPPIFVVECMGAWANQGGTVTFVVGIVGPTELPYDLGGDGPVSPSAGMDAVSFSFSSSTPAWATPKTIELDARKSLDVLTQPFGGAGSISARGTPGGPPARIDLIQARVEVWAYSTSTNTVPRLFGLVVREFCGPGT